MKFYISTDWHLNHENIKTYCQRPDDYMDLIMKRHNQTVRDEDTCLVLGDNLIGHKRNGVELIKQMKGRLILVRGNHDRDKSCGWWMENGFDFACDAFVFRRVLFTHEPATFNITDLGCEFNIHGHLHNCWDGFINPANLERDKEYLGFDPRKGLRFSWQRLLSIEYTNYYPVELDKFLANPEKYQATGPRRKDGPSGN